MFSTRYKNELNFKMVTYRKFRETSCYDLGEIFIKKKWS